MKKYPFSTKAMKAMIAATVAFTPLAATSSLFQAEKVEAAQTDYKSIESLITYLDKVYGQLSSDEKKDLDAARDKLSSITQNEWDAYALKIAVNETENVEAKKQLLGATIELFASVNVADLKGKVADFRSQQAGNVNTVFGSEVTVDKVLAFIADVEYTYLQYLKDADLSKLTDAELYDKFRLAVLANVSKHTTVADKFTQTVDLIATKEVMKEIANQRIDSDGKARTALINALKKVQPTTPPVVTPPGGGPGVPDDPEEKPEDPKPGDSGVIVTPVEETVGNEVIGKIPDTQVDKIVDAITPEKSEVTINLPKAEAGKAVSVMIPAGLVDKLEGKAPGATIVIKTGNVSYELKPANIDTEALAKELGVPASQLSLKVAVNPVPSARATEVTNAVQAKGAKVLSQIVDFTIEAVGNNKSVVIHNLGNRFIDRGFGLDVNVNSSRATGVRVNADGTFSSVPTKFVTKGGKSTAVVRSLRNSEYTVVEGDVTFPDVDKGANWAEKYIESLASKYIIEGETSGKYSPNKYMTRAQFAVLLARALGLPEAEYDGRFKDVKGTEWFNKNGALMATVKYGIVAGTSENTFAPNANITRAQATAMIGRALKLDFLNFDPAKLDKDKKLADFKDGKTIGAATREDVLVAYQAGIVGGTGAGTFAPEAFTKRDQMAKILGEFLVKADLINDLK